MKIGTVTFVNDLNYGCVFQAYALQIVLKKLGFQSEVLDYWHSESNYLLTGINYHSKVGIKKKCGHFISNLFTSRVENNNSVLRSKETRTFIEKYIPLSRTIYKTYNELKNATEYDTYITGSDQIWNSKLHRRAFSLDFVRTGNRKIVYAGSFGMNNIPDEKKEYFKNMLSNYTNISVRELIGKKIIKELVNLDVPVVLDPTLLLDEDDFKFNKDFFCKDKYIFVYWLGAINKILPKLKEIADTEGIYIYYLSSRSRLIDIVGIRNFAKYFKIRKFLQENKKIKLMLSADPIDFLTLMKNAEYVITDSFHGTALSIVLKKNFISYISEYNRDNGKGSRIIELLESLNLNARIKHKFDDFFMEKTINYNDVAGVLHNRRLESIDYLLNALS